jgi:hypothetical protein
MNPQSRTPEGWPNRCPTCGAQLPIDASHTIDKNLECTGCYAQISFVRLKGMIHAYPVTRRNWSKQVAAEDRELSKLIPEEIAREHRICPISAVDDLVEVVTSDPNDKELHDKLQFICLREIYFLQAESDIIDLMIDEIYRKEER